ADAPCLSPRHGDLLPHRGLPARGGDGARRPRPGRARPAAGGAHRGRRRPRRARAPAALLQDHPLPADRRAGPGGARRAAQGHRAGGAAARMKLRDGIYPRFLLLAACVLAMMLGVVGVMLHRQATMQREVVELSQESIHALVSSRVRERGEAVAAQLADSLVNPLYYFDLDAIGVVLRGVLKQSDVRYAIVYDNGGAVIHDGSEDISTYGQAMQDPLAYEVVTAQGLHVQETDRILDVSPPVRIGEIGRE